MATVIDRKDCLEWPGCLVAGYGQINRKNMKGKVHHQTNYSEYHWNVRLSNETACEIWRKYKPRKYTAKMLAQEYGLSPYYVMQLVHGKKWKKDNQRRVGS